MTRRDVGVLNVILVIAVGTFIAITVFALVAIPRILSTQSATDAFNRGNEITSCRAQKAAAVTDANSSLTAHKAQLDVLTSREIRAVVDRDLETLGDILPKIPPAEDRVSAAVDELNARNAEYQAAVDLAQADPSRFLVECRKEG